MGLDGIQRRRAGTERRGSPHRFDPTGPRPPCRPALVPGRPRSLQLDIEVGATKDVELTGILAALDLAGRGFAQGKVIATGADGTAREISSPWLGKVSGMQFDSSPSWMRMAHKPSSPWNRLARSHQTAPPGSSLWAAPSRRMPQREWPSPSIFQETWGGSVLRDSRGLTADPGSGSWYEFKPDSDCSQPSEIGLEDWIEAPAGQRGRIQFAKDDNLVLRRPTDQSSGG